ncbi:hypothetical protein D3C71_1660240 [compost metagenome]
MMSAASLATSTAVSTEMPMSAARSAAASLMPSPRNPTTWPLALSMRTMRSLCAGLNLAKMLWVSTAWASSTSSMRSTSPPSTMACSVMPTSLQTLTVTAALSPVSTLICTPCCVSACKAGAVLSLGGSMKATKPHSTMPASSATP